MSEEWTECKQSCEVILNIFTKESHLDFFVKIKSPTTNLRSLKLYKLIRRNSYKSPIVQSSSWAIRHCPCNLNRHAFHTIPHHIARTNFCRTIYLPAHLTDNTRDTLNA